MQEAQRPIAAWMRAMMKKHALSANAWALKAKLGRNTVGRAVREDYPHVTAFSTLVKLSNVLDEPLPFGPSIPAGSELPSVESLEEIVDAIGEIVAPGREVASREIRRSIALALRDTLAVVANEPELARDPAQARIVARSLAYRVAH